VTLPEIVPWPTLRIGDEERETAVAFLRQSCGAGRLSLDEFSERTGMALDAATAAELWPVVADLPGARHMFEGTEIEAPRSRPKVKLSIFGDHHQTGRWHPGSRVVAVAIFGHLILDLTEAVFEDPDTVIHAFAVFGSVNVTASEDVELDCSAIGIFGRVGGVVAAPDPRTQPQVVRVDGAAVFGNITTRTRAKGAARRAMRALRNAL
jgi:hypothetical protein